VHAAGHNRSLLPVILVDQVVRVAPWNVVPFLPELLAGLPSLCRRLSREKRGTAAGVRATKEGHLRPHILVIRVPKTYALLRAWLVVQVTLRGLLGLAQQFALCIFALGRRWRRFRPDRLRWGIKSVPVLWAAHIIGHGLAHGAAGRCAALKCALNRQRYRPSSERTRRLGTASLRRQIALYQAAQTVPAASRSA
jgi:hypothetical protein